MRFFTLLLISFSFISLAAEPIENKQQNHSISENQINLFEAVDKALKKSYNLKIQYDEQFKLKNKLTQSYMGMLPNVNAGINHNNLKRHSINTHTVTKDKVGSKFINIKQNIFSGGLSVLNIQSAHLNKQTGDIKTKQAVSKTIYAASAAYIELLLAQEMIKQVNIKETRLQKFYESMQTRFELGGVTKTDVSRAKSRLSAAQTEKIATQMRLQNGKHNFYKLTGINSSTLQPIMLDLTIPDNLETALNKAKYKNEDINASKLTTSLAAKQLASAYGKILPKVNLSATVTKYEKNRFNDKYKDRSLLLEVSIPLFNQGTEITDVIDRTKSYSQQKNNHLDTVENILQTVHNAWTEYKMSGAQIISASDAVESADLTFNGVQEEYKSGRKTNLDVLTAEQELYDLKVQLLNSRYQQLLSKLKILLLLGDLTHSHFKQA